MKKILNKLASILEKLKLNLKYKLEYVNYLCREAKPYINIFKHLLKFAYDDFKQYFEYKIDYLVEDINTGSVYAKKVGLITILLLFTFFIVWGCFFKLDSAVVAEGTVVVDNSKKTVQHLEGGIIKKILVKNGDYVKKGQALILLEDKAVYSHYKFLQWRNYFEMAVMNRLISERNQMDHVEYDKILLDSEDDEIKKIIFNQNNLFKIRTESLKQNISILNERIAQLEKQIDGFKVQKKASQDQIALLKEELDTAEKLLAHGLEQKPRILALKRNIVELEGRIGDFDASIARASDAISENKIQIINVNTDRQREVANDIKDAENQIAAIEEELTKATDIYKRTNIVASRSGIITNLHYHTLGGVIAPGAQILDIVPQNDKLVIDAKLLPSNIDQVHKGQKAKVMIAAYNARYLPRLEGIVVDVSPDRLIDEMTHQPYYNVRVTIDKDEFVKLANKIELYPGMPVQVFIIVDKATFMQYLLYPIRASLNKAFIESSKIR